MILHIHAIEATDIPKMDVGGKADPYLEIQLDSSPEIFKTKVVNQNYNPIWNDVFDIPIYEGNPNILHMKLIDMDKVSSDDLISTRDFEVNLFKPGEVTQDWFEFFPAPRIKQGGKVHLIFHLADPNDEPFIPKAPAQEPSNVQEKSLNLEQGQLAVDVSQSQEKGEVTTHPSQSEVHPSDDRQPEPAQDENADSDAQNQPQEQKEAPGPEKVQQRSVEVGEKLFEEDRTHETVGGGLQPEEAPRTGGSNEEEGEPKTVEKTETPPAQVKEREISMAEEKDGAPSSGSRDDFEVFADSNLRPLSSNERMSLIEEDKIKESESRCKMILVVIIAVELFILYLKSKL